jgi:hypothetical protein
VDRAGYHLGTTILDAAGPGSFTGDSAVVIKTATGQTRASAAGKLGLETMEGVCVVAGDHLSERCDFVVAGQRFHALDALTLKGWRRHYDNGVNLEIGLLDPSRPTPVPVPVGWRR